MRRKIYLSLLLVNLLLTLALFAFELGIWSRDALPPLGIAAYKILSQYGLLAFIMIVFNWIFDIEERFEWGLFATGLLIIPVSVFVFPQLNTTLSILTGLWIIPLVALIFFMEYGKELMLSSTIYTIRGLVGKGLVALWVVFLFALYAGVSAGLQMFLSEVAPVAITASQLWFFTIAAIVFIVISYVVKFGYARGIREMENSSYLAEDMKRLLDSSVKVGHLVVLVPMCWIAWQLLTAFMRMTSTESLAPIVTLFYALLVSVIFMNGRGGSKLQFFTLLLASLGPYITAVSFIRTEEILDRILDSFMILGIASLIAIVLVPIHELVYRLFSAKASNQA